MGLILDTSLIIAVERQHGSIKSLLQRLQSAWGEVETAIAAVTVAELTHGIYRAKTKLHRDRRSAFTDDLRRTLTVIPLTTPIAQLAGRIEGEQAAVGNTIAFEDLLIGSTALHLGFGVATVQCPAFRDHSRHKGGFPFDVR